MGKAQRDKGARFERKVATALRGRYPHATVRRNRQSEGAMDSDVSIKGTNTWADWLWIECQDSKNPSPTSKLKQALRDTEALHECQRFPVVVWHKTGQRKSWATFRLCDWLERADALCECVTTAPQVWPTTLVTVELNEFLEAMLP